MDIKERVESYRDELIERLGKLVSINSEEGKSSEDAPFGEGPKEALLTALDMLEKDGVKTTNLDNYIGYGEIGEGEEVIGVIGHLDVVPAHRKDGWKTDPFTMVEEDGVLYGRGVSDDKGAIVASMIAFKVLQDMGTPLNKRVRLIMGTNEESGSRCLKYYVEKEGSVDYGFTPDGDFPGIHGEKGMIAGTYRSKKTGIRAIEGGTAFNVVCPSCTVKIDKNSLSLSKLEDYFNDNDYEYSIEEVEDGINITANGIPAHGSLPQLGLNAISILMQALNEAGFQDPFVDYYNEHFGLTTDGSKLGAACKDQYGELTLNNGMIGMKDGQIQGSVDIRFPVTMNVKQVSELLLSNAEDDNGVFEIVEGIEPLFYAPDSPLVKALLEAYQEVTGDYDTLPMTMGGGTYAKGINNTIAFGCSFPNIDYHIHQANEFVRVDELLKQAEIYVIAIQKLLAL